MADPARPLAVELARRLAALPEAAMRRAVLVEACGRESPPRMVAILHQMVLGARRTPGPPFTEAVETLAAALEEREGGLAYEVRAALYAAAREAGHEDIAHLFFTALPAGEALTAPPGADLELVPGERRGRAARRREREPTVSELRGKPLTLGERKSLARGARRELLDRVLRDPDETVIEIILGNPRITERDVVLLAARRPARPAVLRTVFASRWRARYEVKRALVMNPHTPSDIAVRLVATLSAPDLRAVAGDPVLLETVRAQARRVLATLATAADGGSDETGEGGG